MRVNLTIDSAVMWLILFVLAVILIVYLIVLIRNINESAKVVRRLLEHNEQHVNGIMDNVSAVSSDIVAPVLKGIAGLVCSIQKAFNKDNGPTEN